MFSTFLECFQMSGVYYHSIIHGLGFICYIVYDIELMWQKTLKCTFSMFYTVIKYWDFDQSKSFQVLSVLCLIKLILHSDILNIKKHLYPGNYSLSDQKSTILSPNSVFIILFPNCFVFSSSLGTT